jgi:membrane-associated protease RseP (regulator of RpoE activity)
MQGLLVFVGLVAAWLIVLYWLTATGRMERWKLSTMLGVVLMVRTQHGKGTLEALSRPRRLWNAFADLGTVVTLVGMAGMTFLFLATVWFTLQPGSPVRPLGFSEILVIPGVNPFVPLWYGVIALIVTLVVHEGGHGVLARANNMRIKSLGLLVAVVPIGAFVEPEELDLKVAPRRQRLRVFSAGPAVNLTFAALFLLLFSAVLGSSTLTPGAHVLGPTAGGPAEQAGITALTTIVQADGQPTPDTDALLQVVRQHQPGDMVTMRDDTGREYRLRLGSVWEAYDEPTRDRITRENATLAEQLQGTPRMGVQLLQPEVHETLAHPFANWRTSWQHLLILPVSEVGLGAAAPAPYLGQYLPAFYQTPMPEAVFWPLVTLLFWIFWINLMVGLTNILPMLPLDGGHIFRDTMDGLVQRLRPAMPGEARDRLVGRIAAGVSILILVAFLMQIIGPRLVQALS